jgi:Predicted signaling protein consisting of a modified GGDEF domain and a DHH domain
MENKYNYFAPSNKVYMIIIAFLILILFCYSHLTVGFIALGIYAILMIYNIMNLRVKKNEWRKFIEDFSLNLDTATRNTLINLPFPLIITGVKGNIVWYNQNTSSVLKQEELLGKNISNVIKELDINTVLTQKETVFEYVKIKEKYYNIYTRVVDTEEGKNQNNNIVLIYLYDVTEIRSIIESKEAAVLIEVDNLDEVIKSVEEGSKPLLIAEIERTINNFAQTYQALIKKYSSNKYVISIQERYLEEEMKKKFEILDNIREITMGNKLSVTLSIGVGVGGATPLENYNYAASAKELALGRGGDQAVIKSGEKLLFFGGNTKEVEKRTRVRARVIAHALKDLISESSNVFIMGHKNADIDCVGSAIGINSMVKLLNKECYIVLDPPISGIKQVLDKFKEDTDYDGVFINSDLCKIKIDENSLLILVDVHNKSYVQNNDIVNVIKKVVIIDHHRKSADFINNTILTYIEPYASSTSELVTEMLQYVVEKPKLKQIEAEALLAGICVDTKKFTYKTGVRTFEAASFLRRLGADTIDVKRLFTDNLDIYIKRADIIRSALVEKNIAIAVCPPDIKDTVLAAQAADELLNITGIQASFVFVKIESDVNISGRSLGDINVQVILESLGGGGHMTMAGARLTNASLDEAVNKLKEAISEYLREGE